MLPGFHRLCFCTVVVFSRFTFCILYFQSTLKGGFFKDHFCLEQKQRNLLLKSANKIDVWMHAEDFLWLMDFKSLDVRIIFGKWV